MVETIRALDIESSRLTALIIKQDAIIEVLTAEVERLTYDRNHPYGEVALDTRPDLDAANRGRIYRRLHVGTDALCAHLPTDCCRECPQWAMQAADDRRSL